MCKVLQKTPWAHCMFALHMLAKLSYLPMKITLENGNNLNSEETTENMSSRINVETRAI